MPMSQIKKNVIFPYSVLYIQLDTNTGKNGESSVQLFKRTMIKMPKMDVVPIFTSEYPYFTKNIKYPKSLERADWKTKYEFFFNRQVFLDKLNKQIELYESSFIKPVTIKDAEAEREYYETVQDIEKENVMITLRCLFPIPEVFGKTLKNTYDHVLTSTGNERVVKDINVLSTLNIFGFMYKFGIVKKEKQEYFINIGGKRYMVDNVIWENDLVNHPVYKKFLLAQRNVYEDVENNKFNILQRKDAAEEELKTILNKSANAKDDDFAGNETNDGVKSMYSESNYSFRIANGIAGIFKDDPKNEISIEYPPKLDSIKSLVDKLDESPLPKLSNESRDNLKKYIVKVVSDIDKLVGYLNNKGTTDSTEYKQILEFITKINEIMKDIPESGSKKKLTDVEQQQKENDYKKLFRLVYDIAVYFDKEKSNLKKLGYETAISSKQTTKPKKTKKQNILDKPLVESFKTRIEISVKNSGVQSFQLQQFQNAVSTIKKLLGDVFEVDVETGKLTSNNFNALKKAEKLISIQEEIEQYGKQSNTQQPEKTFFEASEIPFLYQLIKIAIQVKAANIVYDFAENNTPMNLSDTVLDSKNQISDVMKQVNGYITKNYANEVRINNKLSTNTNEIYEPLRKTSNRELYEVIRLFKVGERILKSKNTNLTDEQIKKYKKVINDIYDEYILDIDSGEKDIYEKYLYVGTDDVNVNEKQEDTTQEIKRNVKEIYVQFDLVDADTFEKTSRASCKLYDKELAEEFMYLADPRNKNNRVLSRFRNLDFNSVIPDPLAEAVDPNNPTAAINQPPPTEKKGGYTRRIRSVNGIKTLRSYK